MTCVYVCLSPCEIVDIFHGVFIGVIVVVYVVVGDFYGGFIAVIDKCIYMPYGHVIAVVLTSLYRSNWVLST